MGERMSYAPGTFCATDLGTTDAEGAKSFYGELFGWDSEDVPAGDAGTYTVLRLDGKAVAGLYQREDLPHPAWLSYVSVEDADASAARVTELGGTVVEQPSDIMSAGRIAIVQDPTGAVFALWQPKAYAGAELVNDPGAWVLNQLNTSDLESAKSFYAELFGWRIERGGSEEQPYWGAYVGERLNAGMMPLPEAARDTPPHWLVYFTSADLNAWVNQIGELGGEVTVPPMSIPAGRIAVARDPQGAVFALFEGRVDP